ncbi:MAG: hypothetical protein MOGMAGMI_00371 [Candidatus Omnitrophica bacterium]|nr:hypothetical protein [Candidatus Omnitrophota bacterium]
MTKKYNKGSIVTVPTEWEYSPNTYLVFRELEETCLIHHPINLKFLLEVDKKYLDQVLPNRKSSTEKMIEFLLSRKDFLDYNSFADLEAIGLYFILKKEISPRQKHSLSQLCGKMAEKTLDNNIDRAIRLINSSKGVLDEFNLMWVNNFKNLLEGKQAITSLKQRQAIFNIAGVILAEIESSTVQRSVKE